MTNILQINRNHEDPNSTVSCESKKQKSKNNNNTEQVENDRKDIFADLRSERNKFNNLFSKHIKKKKRYEIQEIAQVMH